jgi:hypothetical protein
MPQLVDYENENLREEREALIEKIIALEAAN